MAGALGSRSVGGTTAVGRLFGDGSVIGLSESELLDRFVGRRDEAAFAALVDRHGPMVLGVCRRMLHDPHDADDAFQAVFLILARKAGGIGRKELVGNWLYGVSRRVATRARVLAARRVKTGGELDVDAHRPGAPGPAEAASRDELGERLHEEVGRLPERYRAPVVACYFEGKSCEEAAAMLDCPVGTVKGRLSRARDLLRRRLERRGVTAPLALLATALAAPDLRAAVPPALAAQAVREGLAAASSPFAWMTVSVASNSIGSLAEGVIRTMLYAKLKSLALPAGLVAAGLLAAGAGLAASQDAPAPKPEPNKESKPPASKSADNNQETAAPHPFGAMMPGMGGMGMPGVPGAMPGVGTMSVATGMGMHGGGGMPMMGGMGGGVLPGDGMAGPGDPGGFLVPVPVIIARASAFLAAHDEEGVNKDVLDSLDRKLSVRLGEDSTLADLLKQLREVEIADGKPLPVFVSRSGLSGADVTLSSPVELDLDGVPLKAALRLALKELGLAYCVRDGVLIISSPEEIRIELHEAQAEWLARNPDEGYEMGRGGVIEEKPGWSSGMMMMGGGGMGRMGGPARKGVDYRAAGEKSE